jgi:hypothetical protein
LETREVDRDNQNILVALGRLEGKVDALISRQNIVDARIDRHDTRIRELEQSKSWLLGAAGVVGAIASLAAKAIFN